MKEELKKDLGGGNSSNQIPSNSQELVLTIPEELRGKELNIVYGASWINDLKVNDSNNTVTGSVLNNPYYTSRSATITLTASGNLSISSPYSFTITQVALDPPLNVIRVTFNDRLITATATHAVKSNLVIDVSFEEISGGHYSATINMTLGSKSSTADAGRSIERLSNASVTPDRDNYYRYDAMEVN